MISKYPSMRYVSGTYKRSSDVSGFDYLKSQLVKRWDGNWVEPKNWDPLPRHLRPKKIGRELKLRFE